ncbi:unnamed protein product [Urochloa humidicola]
MSSLLFLLSLSASSTTHPFREATTPAAAELPRGCDSEVHIEADNTCLVLALSLIVAEAAIDDAPSLHSPALEEQPCSHRRRQPPPHRAPDTVAAIECLFPGWIQAISSTRRSIRLELGSWSFFISD